MNYYSNTMNYTTHNAPHLAPGQLRVVEVSDQRTRQAEALSHHDAHRVGELLLVHGAGLQHAEPDAAAHADALLPGGQQTNDPQLLDVKLRQNRSNFNRP